MSNFICSECGMTNIDCGRDGYKTPKEIELEKQIERLQEQLNEAHWIIKLLIKNSTNYYPRIREAKNYLKKYGVDYDKIEESGV